VPLCEVCGKAIGSVKFCPECGTRTKLDQRVVIDRERFESLESAIAETYATRPVRPFWPNALRRSPFFWVALAVCSIVAAFAGTLLWVRHQPATQLEAAPLAAPSLIVAQKTAAPSTPPPRRATPSPAPTSVPTATLTPSPPPTPVISLDDAPALVRSNAQLRVGTKGSCNGENVSVDVRGFTRGCTLFGLASSGPLSNGKGTVLIVPVSTTEDVADVAYGLLYIQSGAAAEPRFLGLLAGDGSRPLVIRVQKGLIVLQNGTSGESFTFDGHHIVQVHR
jgi:hypothetical protein